MTKTSTEMMVVVIGILHKCLLYIAVCQEKKSISLEKKNELGLAGSGPGPVRSRSRSS